VCCGVLQCVAVCRLCQRPDGGVDAVCCSVLQCVACVRGLMEVSIARGEGKFVLLQLAFESIFGRQVCNFAFVPEKTG